MPADWYFSASPPGSFDSRPGGKPSLSSSPPRHVSVAVQGLHQGRVSPPRPRPVAFQSDCPSLGPAGGVWFVASYREWVDLFETAKPRAEAPLMAR
jgi:hypothetical protein